MARKAKRMLEVSGLETSYGSSQVLFGMEFSVNDGEVVTLMGRNGMGGTKAKAAKVHRIATRRALIFMI